MLPIFKYSILLISNRHLFSLLQIPLGYLILRGYSKVKFYLYLAKDLLGHFWGQKAHQCEFRFFFPLRSCNGDSIWKLEKQFLKDISVSYDNEEVIIKNLKWLLSFNNHGGEKLIVHSIKEDDWFHQSLSYIISTSIWQIRKSQ